MRKEPASPEFTHWVHKALASLYDPSELASSPLADLLIAGREADRASALQRTLLDAIESLCPSSSAPVGSRAWRVYQILRARYTEQVPQPRVASGLGLSTRQLQREEAIARSVLAERVWAVHDVAAQRDSVAAAPVPPVEPAPGGPDTGQELAAQARSLPITMTDVGAILQAVLQTIGPLASAAQVTLAPTVQPNLPRIPLQAPLLRQALLNIMEAAIGYGRGTSVGITCEVENGRLSINVDAARPGHPSSPQTLPHNDEVVDQARQLVALCFGTFESSLPDGALRASRQGDAVLFKASLSFPTVEQVTVLVVDDNADALKLLKRYLAGSRYRFVPAQTAKQALETAIKLQPQIVLLDVMMPEDDGWTVLGALREHPKTRHIPVIVCTILAQKDLALALGADEFMRKPISQPDLLAALDRQVDQQPVRPPPET